jgi:hypothetical protein
VPVWLLTLLTQVLEPIVQKIIEGLLVAQRLSSLEKNQQATLEAFQKLQSAETEADRDAALDAITKSWNH